MYLKSQKKLLVWVLVCIVFAVTIFYYNNYKIPQLSKQIETKIRREIDDNAMPKQKVAVVIDSAGISKYTELTEQMINEKIQIVDVPIKYLVKNPANDIDLIIGKIAKEDLRPGEQISLDSLSSDKKWYGEYQRLKEYKVTSIVANEVKTGNIIDIVVAYGNGDYDIVVPKTKVIKLVTPPTEQQQGANQDNSQSQNQEGTQNNTQSNNPGSVNDGYTLIMAVDEEQYRDIELAKQLGKLETRLYLEENQQPSKKTFNYAAALAKAKLAGVSTKGGQSAPAPQPVQQQKANPAQPANNDDNKPIRLVE
ncbi:MAG: SAF domain-containing protein [Clostridia bacterium]|nr:SAF domain-containing protein [Clostridia bacterium]